MCCVALRVFVHLLQFTQCAELCLRLQVSKSFIIIIFFFFALALLLQNCVFLLMSIHIWLMVTVIHCGCLVAHCRMVGKQGRTRKWMFIFHIISILFINPKNIHFGQWNASREKKIIICMHEERLLCWFCQSFYSNRIEKKIPSPNLWQFHTVAAATVAVARQHMHFTCMHRMGGLRMKIVLSHHYY